MPVGSRQSQTMFTRVPASGRQSGSFGLDGAGNAGSAKGTTISFTAPATIADSASQLGNFKVNDIIVVLGSAANSRSWTVQTSAAGTLTVSPALVTTEVAGTAITLIRD
jgi:hypothetical protein